MAPKVELNLVVRAVDKATGPIKSLTRKLDALNAPGKEFSKSLSKLGEATGFGKLGGALSGVGSAARNVAGEVGALGLRVAGLAAAAGFAFYSIVKGAVDAGDKLSEMAQRTGLAVDVYASLEYAAAQADVEQEAFNSAMDKFNKNLGEAKAGGGSLLTFLNKVSPTLGRQVVAAKTTEAALSLMTDAFTRIEDPAKRAALASAAFGRSGLQMGQFLGQGSPAIQAAQLHYLKLAGSQEKFAAASSELDNVLKDTEVAMTGARNAIALKLYPAVTKIATALSNFLEKNREGIAQWAEKAGRAIEAWVDGGGLDRLFTGLSAVATVVGRVIEFLGPMGTTVAVVGVLALPLISAIASLGVAFVSFEIALFGALPAIGAVVVAVAPIAGMALLATAAFVGFAAAGYQIYKNWENLGMIFSDIGRELDNLFGKMSMLEKLNLLLNPIAQAKFLYNAVRPVGPTEDSALTPEARARAARFSSQGLNSSRPANVSTTNNAAVSIDFSNVPAGTRIRSNPANTAPLNMSVGPAGATP